MMKIEGAAKRAPDTLFSDPNDPTFGVMTYVAQVSRHFVEHGLDGLFYFLSPEGKWIDIVLAHPQVSREDVQGQYNVLDTAYFNVAEYNVNLLPSSRYDMYDKQNSLWSASYILSSISSPLRNQLLTKAGPDYDKGPVVWMYLMGMLGSSTTRGFKSLRTTFESRKLKSEPSENVSKHTIKVRDDYKRLSNANISMDDCLLTTIDNMVECSTQPFNVWASTKRIEINKFLKENMGKSALVWARLPNAPSVEGICDEADDEYLSLFEAGLWTAVELKKDKQAAPAAFLISKITQAIDKLSVQTNNNDTCWTCGKVGHRSPQCPEKPLKSEGNRKRAGKNRGTGYKACTRNATWQAVRPAAGEPETILKDGRTFYWCDQCTHWRTTHGTKAHKSTLTGAVGPKSILKTAPGTLATGKLQANMAEIIQLGSELSELSLGAWCAIMMDSDSLLDAMEFDLGVFGADIFDVDHFKKRGIGNISSDVNSLAGDSYVEPEFMDHWDTPKVISNN